MSFGLWFYRYFSQHQAKPTLAFSPLWLILHPLYIPHLSQQYYQWDYAMKWSLLKINFGFGKVTFNTNHFPNLVCYGFSQVSTVHLRGPETHR